MAVRRHAARLAAVCGCWAAWWRSARRRRWPPRLGPGGSAGSFTAGGSAGAVIHVRKRSDGCVLLRTALGLRLDGLRADQASVQVNVGGRWFPVPSPGVAAVRPPGHLADEPEALQGQERHGALPGGVRGGAPGGRLTGQRCGQRRARAGPGPGHGRVPGGRRRGPRPRRRRSPRRSRRPRPSTVAAEMAGVEDPSVTAGPGQGAGPVSTCRRRGGVRPAVR